MPQDGQVAIGSLNFVQFLREDLQKFAGELFVRGEEFRNFFSQLIIVVSRL